MSEKIKGADLKVGDRVKLWFMPEGTTLLELTPYVGNLTYLFKEGAQIGTFSSLTKRGRTEMTIDNSDYFDRA